MATFLFAAMPASGHVNPLVTIARRLQGDGHVVVFVLPRGVDDTAGRVAGQGFPVRQVAPPPGYAAFLLLPHLSGFLETAYALLLISGGLPHLARAVGAVIDDIRPDAVVADFGFPAANLAAERAGLPHVTVYHAGLAYEGPGVPPFGSGLPIGGSWGTRGRWYRLLSGLVHRCIHGAWRRARRRLRLPPAAPRHIWDSPWLTLLATTHGIEAPRHPYPTATYLVGPCFAGRHEADHEAFPFERLATDRPVVYVSLGTVFNNKPHVFRRIFDAFSDGRCQLVVSAGGACRALSRMSLPPHVLLFEAIPQVALLPRVDAVISHGGNNTVNETLAAGKPLLVMPVGGEQGDNASRVVYLGAGLRARLDAPSAEIRAAVDALLTSPRYRQSAQACARAIAATDGPATAARLIAHVAATRRPLPAPPGYPLTITRDTPMPWEFGQP